MTKPIAEDLQRTSKPLEKAKSALFETNLSLSLECARRAVEDPDSNSEAFLFLGHLEEHFLQDPTQAAKTYREGLQRYPSDPSLLLEQGRLFAQIENWPAAEDSLRATLNTQRMSDASQASLSCRYCLLRELGAVYAAQGSHSQARECWEEALRAHPMGFEVNRLLRCLYLKEGIAPNHQPSAPWSAIGEALSEFVSLWKLDHGILHGRTIHGTIAADAEAMDRVLAAYHQKPGVDALHAFVTHIDAIGLHDEALLLWRFILRQRPDDAGAQRSAARLQQLKLVLQQYKNASLTIYRNLANTGKRTVRRDRQTLYTVLRKMEQHCSPLQGLPERASKKAWRELTSLYEKHFRLHIRAFFSNTELYGTYVSHVVNERYYLLDRSYNRSKFIYRELARDVERSFNAWIWHYFGQAPAGWAGEAGWTSGSDKRIIYRCTDAFKNCMQDWAVLHDADTEGRLQREIQEAQEKGGYAPDDVFHHEAVSQRVRFRQSHNVLQAVLTDMPVSLRENEMAVKTAFFQRFYEHSLLTTLIRHEGPGALKPRSLISLTEAIVYGLRRGLFHPDGAAEYKARAMEMRNGLLPYETLRGILSRDIESSSPFGRAHQRLLRDIFRHISRNPTEYPQVDTNRSLLLQLPQLTEEQLRAIAATLLR